MWKQIVSGLYGWALISSALALYLIPGSSDFVDHHHRLLGPVLFCWFGIGLAGPLACFADGMWKLAWSELTLAVSIGYALTWTCFAVNEPAILHIEGSPMTLFFFSVLVFASGVLMARQMPRPRLQIRLSFG